MSEPLEPPDPAELGSDPVAVAREIALRQLTVRSRTVAELRTALARRHVPTEAAEEVLGRFSEVGLLDDAEFAKDWVAAGERRLRGRQALARELRTKGVAEEIVTEALAERDPALEESVAMEVARKKAAALRGLPAQTQYRRLAGVLARRGFSSSIVARVCRKVLDEWDEDDSLG